MVRLKSSFKKGTDMAKQTKIGSKVFETKKELKEYVQYILYKSKKGEPLNGIHLKVVDSVFRNHESYEDKVAGQDYKISVRTSSGVNKKYREFYIIREDWSETDFSYVKALAGKSCKISDIKRTLRQVVLQQQWDAKTKYFEENQDSLGNIVCAVTGLKMKYKESHIDHYPVKFETIVANWFKENQLTSETFELEDGGDNSVHDLVKDKELEKSFYDYHMKNAKYRVVLSKVNLQSKQGKREVF